MYFIPTAALIACLAGSFLLASDNVLSTSNWPWGGPAWRFYLGHGLTWGGLAILYYLTP